MSNKPQCTFAVGSDGDFDKQLEQEAKYVIKTAAGWKKSTSMSSLALNLGMHRQRLTRICHQLGIINIVVQFLPVLSQGNTVTQMSYHETMRNQTTIRPVLIFGTRGVYSA
jgi:hypothetical protein